MPIPEDDLKLQNWLSILTYDAFKFVKAGGELVVEWTEEGLVLRLPGITPDTEWLNSKFRKYAGQAADPVAMEAEP
jgi:hypothetical protein